VFDLFLQTDLQPKEEFNWFYIPPPEPLDDKIFSPLHTQVQAELGSSCGYYPINNNSSNNFVDETEADLSEFLDSILDYSYDDKMGVNQSKPGAEVAQNMVSREVSSSEIHQINIIKRPFQLLKVDLFAVLFEYRLVL